MVPHRVRSAEYAFGAGDPFANGQRERRRARIPCERETRLHRTDRRPDTESHTPVGSRPWCATPYRYRSSFRTTSFSPDQTSVTAQTLTSTKPSGSATARTTSSVTSVGTFEDFFGQDTQTAAAGASFAR